MKGQRRLPVSRRASPSMAEIRPELVEDDGRHDEAENHVERGSGAEGQEVLTAGRRQFALRLDLISLDIVGDVVSCVVAGIVPLGDGDSRSTSREGDGLNFSRGDVECI